MRSNYRCLAETEVQLMPSGFPLKGTGAYQSVRLLCPLATTMEHLSVELQLLIVAHLSPRDITHVQQVSYHLRAPLGEQ